MALCVSTPCSERFPELLPYGDLDAERASNAMALVERTAFPTIPPRVEYALTGAGHSLKAPLQVLVSWARSRQEGSK